jgi:squalene-hopene/tetraprenyl-beta-curcumene cyclase
MVLSYLWCGFDKDDLPVKLAVAWLKKNYSVEKHPNANKNGQQGLYYYYRVMSKALTAYGEPVFAGHPWGRDLAAAIIERQREDGSWSNPEDRWREGDPALVTGYALTALALAQKAAKQVKAD